MTEDFWTNDFQKPKWDECTKQFLHLRDIGGRNKISDSWHIAIEITSSCRWKCANCSRAIRHIEKPFNASLEFIEKALDSLEGWNRGVTIMGGEPQEHPQFEEICKLLKNYDYPFGIFTSLPATKLIRETFDSCYFTNHKEEINLHHPLLIAPDEVIDDPILRDEVIKNCWYRKGCNDAVITPWGAFWCEIASVIARIYNKEGYPIEKDWWRRDTFDDQMYLCQKCGLCIPTKLTTDKDRKEWVSPKIYEMLKKCNSPNLEKLEIYKEKLDKNDINYRLSNKWPGSLSFRVDRVQPLDERKFF